MKTLLKIESSSKAENMQKSIHTIAEGTHRLEMGSVVWAPVVALT